jgi:hypothetical protein
MEVEVTEGIMGRLARACAVVKCDYIEAHLTSLSTGSSPHVRRKTK